MRSTVTEKGQVTLPKAIRDRLGIRPGMRLDFEVMADNTLQAKMLTRGSSGWFGLLHRPGEAARTVDEIDDAIAAAAKERTRRKL